MDEVQRGGAGGELALLFRDDVLSNMISFRSTTAAAFLDDVRRHGAEVEVVGMNSASSILVDRHAPLVQAG